MARRVQEQDIINMNEAYLICGSYSGAAEATGWSAATVKRYIDPNYVSSGNPFPEVKEKDIKVPTVDEAMNYLLSNSNLSQLTDTEKEDMKNIWKGLLI